MPEEYLETVKLSILIELSRGYMKSSDDFSCFPRLTKGQIVRPQKALIELNILAEKKYRDTVGMAKTCRNTKKEKRSFFDFVVMDTNSCNGEVTSRTTSKHASKQAIIIHKQTTEQASKQEKEQTNKCQSSACHRDFHDCFCV